MSLDAIHGHIGTMGDAQYVVDITDYIFIILETVWFHWWSHIYIWIGLRNTYQILWYNRCVSEGCCSFCSMNDSNIPCLSLIIKYYVACDLLISCINLGGRSFPFFKSWSNVPRLLHDSIPSKSVLVKLVNIFFPLHILKYLNIVFVSLNPLFRLNLGKNVVTLL